MRIGPLGVPEILIILVVVLLIFGPRRLPEMAKGLGQSVREFRKGIRDIRNEVDEAAATPAPTPAQAASQTTAPAPPSAGSQSPDLGGPTSDSTAASAERRNEG